MIKREAKDLFQAMRLQKLRAIVHILDHIEASPNDDEIGVAVEILEDVYKVSGEGELFEQNKDYDPETKFTLNTEEILNSFSSFIEIWVDNQLSAELSFCFLSTNKVGKEKSTSRIKKLQIELPKGVSILKELASSDSERIKKVSPIVKKIVFDYYKENYSTNPEAAKTISALKGVSDESWTGFLNQINWVFGFTSVEELDKIVLEKIKTSRLYSKYDDQDKEELIKSGLVDLIEKKTLKDSKYFRIVSLSDIKVVFNDAIYQTTALEIDPVFKLWEQIDKPTDTRNLTDKILDVCPEYSKLKLKHLDRTAAMAKVAESKVKNSPKYLALKYRIFAFCDRRLDEIISKRTTATFTEVEIESIIDKIQKECSVEFDDLKRQFDYGVERRGIIFELFIEFIDSCYLAFDS
ncbi:hypothetical protein [Gilvibacter sediminis]|uniref:hypothetical protein n=1 Tax=Gilvibacter sediminis TaxID=379071 RepID=UPI002350C3A6|nr:hypothetical protein [Gilvibacter sediminis]MDC7997381.1 hypothetical protein [Gilvibacter sediminis]